MILLQITRSVLSLTCVKSGRRAAFDLPRSFELPENLKDGRGYTDIPLLAKFTKECILKAQLNCKNILFCIEDDGLVSKEYQHLPSKRKNLLAFARLEAEAVLSDNIDDYLIQNYEYGHTNEITGKLTSVLFASKSKLIAGIRRSFAQRGLRVVKIVPPIGGLLYAAKTAINSSGQTVAVLDLGFEKTHLLVLHEGFPVFQRTFESIYEDILNILCEEQSVSFRDAIGLVNSWGVYGESNPSGEASKRISTLLDASANEVVRNIRMVLSSERLELNRIVFCGAMSTLPNFIDFWNQLGLDVPLESIDIGTATRKLPEVRPAARSAGLRPASFFGASGLLSAGKADDIDFLKAVKAKSGAQAANITVMVVLTLVAMGIMALEPIWEAVSTAQVQLDHIALTAAEATGIKDSITKQTELTNAIASAKKDRDKLPFGKSKTEEIAEKLTEQIGSKSKAVSSIAVDNNTGSISVSFTVANYDTFLTMKHNIESNGYFVISGPFSATFQPDGTCSCNLILQVNQFTPWETNSKEGVQSEKP